jgi:hypothetical protein
LTTDLGIEAPLDEYRRAAEGPAVDFGEELARNIERTDRAQEAVAQCMKDSGFEYYPVPYQGSRFKEAPSGFSPATMPIPSLSPDRETVARWGYGVQAAPEPNQGDPFRGQDPGVAEADKKNQDYRDSLSREGRDAYDRKLRGFTEADVVDPTDLAPTPDPDTCARVPGEPMEASDPRADLLLAYSGVLLGLREVTATDVPMDPRSLALHEEWNTCMVDKGFDTAPEITETKPGSADIDTGVTTTEIRSETGYGDQASPLNAAKLAQTLDPAGGGLLVADPAQIRIALADFDCRAATDYLRRITDLQIELEQAFVDKHRRQLDEMTTAMEGQG